MGEHAVVYGQPAIAVPVAEVRATCKVTPAEPGSGLTIVADDLGTVVRLEDAAPLDPLAAAARLVLAHLEEGDTGTAVPDALCHVRSTIPVASGLGSGAAVTAALVRALAEHEGRPLTPSEVSAMVYEVEKLHHGSPSGIDNTVIAFEQPVVYRQGRLIERLRVGTPFLLLIGDTGVASSTRDAVDYVRLGWERNRARFDGLFTAVGGVVRAALPALESGDLMALGHLMDRNQTLLTQIGVSTPELDGLVAAARQSGALGAKLVGAGKGGAMVALVRPGDHDRVDASLRRAGAVRVISTCVAPVAHGAR